MPTDITSWFTRQCQDLAPGKLVKHRTAGLLEIMNSLAIMDPKMDTGMTIRPEHPFDPTALLTEDVLCWTMDQMMALEYRWWLGENLCQTVFTCLYYHNIDKIEDEALRVYTLVYAKCIDLAYTELAKAHVRDGEDSWLDHYGISVHMDDSVGGILALIDAYLPRADSPAIRTRLEVRRAILQSLCLSSAVKPINVEHVECCSAPNRSPFVDVSPHLRQCMPLPPVKDISHDVAWEGVLQFLRDIDTLQRLRSGTELDWKMALRGRAWLSPMQPLTRSLNQSVLSSLEPQDSDDLLFQWLFRLGGISPEEISDAATSVPEFDNWKLRLWREQIHAYFISTLSTSLLNTPRQRRTYMSLSYNWREAVFTATTLSRYHPSFTKIAHCLYAARLDCLLEASLAAFELHLVSSYDSDAFWWFIQEVTAARAHIPIDETWESLWSQAWYSIASGMRTLCARPRVTREQFDLRHKWGQKLPSGAGSTRDLDLSFDGFQKTIHTKVHVATGSKENLDDLIEEAQVHLQNLLQLTRLPPAHAFSIVVSNLQNDLRDLVTGGPCDRTSWITREP